LVAGFFFFSVVFAGPVQYQVTVFYTMHAGKIEVKEAPKKK